MANVRKGLKRVVWIFSITASIAAWVLIFRAADIKPEKNINKAGAAFVNQLDKHYFVDAPRLTLSEFRLTRSTRDKNRVEMLIAKIDNSIKSDSIDRWPFAWEYIPENAKRLDPDTWLIHTRWQDRMRKALQLNEKEIRKAFADLNFSDFLDRYSSNNLLIGKYKSPESYFKISYQRPFGRIALLFLAGFIPFLAIWALWFMINWVINGFRG